MTGVARLGAAASVEPPVIASLRRQAVARPDLPLLHFLDFDECATSFTARQVLDRSAELGTGLLRAGVREGDRVVLLFDTCPDVAMLFFAAMMIGAVPCIGDLPASGRAIQGWLRRLNDRITLIDPAIVVLDDRIFEMVRETLEAHPAHPTIATTDELSGSTAAAATFAPQTGDVAFMQFTSGTTKAPRALQISHDALTTNVRVMARGLAYGPDDVMVGWLPLFHDMGLVATMLTGVLCEMATVLMSPMAFLLDPACWLRAIARYRGTVSFAPNFAYQLCVKRVEPAALEDLDLSCWKRAINAAEFVQLDTVQCFGDLVRPCGVERESLKTAYGLAEFTVGVCATAMDSSPPLALVSRRALADRGVVVAVDDGNADALAIFGVGRMPETHEARVVDADGRELPDRTQGEILLRGPSLFSGYYRDPIATAAVLKDGWLWTGDLGYFDDGELYLCGRIKDLIIKAGENHHPYPLEAAACEVSGVRAGCVAAFGLEDALTGTEEIVMVIETAEEDPGKVATMCADVTRRVTDRVGIRPDRVIHARPRTLPKTTNGKIRRDAVRALVVSGELS